MRRKDIRHRLGKPGQRVSAKVAVGNPYRQTRRELVDRAEQEFKGGGRVSEWTRKAFESLPSSDASARPGFPGEQHAILKLPNGLPGVANFMGPRTALVERIKRGDPPRTLSDKVAQRHDIDYSLAKGQADIVKADSRMVSKLKAIQKAKGDSIINTQLGMRPIQAKMMAERSGLVKPGVIAEIGGVPSKDIPLLTSKRSELEQEGFGIRPGDLLREEIMRSMKKDAKKKKLKGGRAISASTSSAGKLYGGRAPASYIDESTGAVIVGGGLPKALKAPIKAVGNVGRHIASVANEIHSFITKHQLPQLFSEMSGLGLGLSGKGIRLAGQGIVKDLKPAIMEMVLSSIHKQPLTGSGRFSRSVGSLIKTAKPIAKGVASLVLPILIGIAKNSIEKKLSGGMGGSVNGVPMEEYMRKFNNPGVMGKLGNYLTSALWNGIKRMLSKGNTMGGSGMNLAGGSFASFWKGFKKGFSDVFGVVSNVAKVAAPFIPLLL